ncbi:MAG: Smr/MutS family protein [Bacilli bacterium]|nr:Smr/MutS family protein [Bacilli bacterium]
MNRIINDPFTARYPKLDIHGETTLTCIAIIKSFINDNYKLKNKNIIIIHGKGTGALKKATHEYLKGHKMVEKYYIDGLNDGQTIVELKI